MSHCWFKWSIIECFMFSFGGVIITFSPAMNILVDIFAAIFISLFKALKIHNT